MTFYNLKSSTKSLHFLVLSCALKCKLVLYLRFMLYAVSVYKALSATIGLFFFSNIDQSFGPDEKKNFFRWYCPVKGFIFDILSG